MGTLDRSHTFPMLGTLALALNFTIWRTPALLPTSLMVIGTHVGILTTVLRITLKRATAPAPTSALKVPPSEGTPVSIMKGAVLVLPLTFVLVVTLAVAALIVTTNNSRTGRSATGGGGLGWRQRTVVGNLGGVVQWAWRGCSIGMNATGNSSGAKPSSRDDR